MSKDCENKRTIEGVFEKKREGEKERKRIYGR
jgi:hypothetical protein